MAFPGPGTAGALRLARQQSLQAAAPRAASPTSYLRATRERPARPLHDHGPEHQGCAGWTAAQAPPLRCACMTHRNTEYGGHGGHAAPKTKRRKTRTSPRQGQPEQVEAGRVGSHACRVGVRFAADPPAVSCDAASRGRASWRAVPSQGVGGPGGLAQHSGICGERNAKEQHERPANPLSPPTSALARL